MFVDDPNAMDDFERKLKFNEIAEQFGRSIAAWETAPWTTSYDLLRRAGVEMPPADELDDDQLTDALWRIIEQLAKLNTFLCSTDHLSERALYVELINAALREPTKDFAAVLPEEDLSKPGAWSHHIDICDSGDPEQWRVYLRYYADDAERAEHVRFFPDEPLPPRAPTPYDRDRFLPRPVDDRPDVLETMPEHQWFQEDLWDTGASFESPMSLDVPDDELFDDEDESWIDLDESDQDYHAPDDFGDDRRRQRWEDDEDMPF